MKISYESAIEGMNARKVLTEERENKKYRIGFMHVPAEQKTTFLHSKCLMPISVGQNYHEGNKLEAALKCMNKNFRGLVLVIGDTIQRYTYAAYLDQTSDALFEFAKMEGDKWLQRNDHIIKSTLTKPYKIFRWEHYRQHSRFKHHFSIIDAAYLGGDSEYKVAFEKDTEDFLQRAGRSEAVLSSDSVALCLQYLKEEGACMCLWAEEEKCEFLAYPYGINNVFRTTYQKFIKGPYNGILQEIPYSMKGKILTKLKERA